MKSSLKFLSLNIGMSSSLAGLSAIVDFEDIDVVFLQEICLTSDQIEQFLRGYRAVSNIDQENINTPGIALAWRQEIPVENVSNLAPCRLQSATIGSYFLINLYAPSGSNKKHERSQFFSQQLFQALNLAPRASWILGGDYNCLLKEIDVEGGKGFLSKRCDELADIVASFHLVDAFRVLYPDKQEFTFYRAGNAASRLDKFYISSNLKPLLLSTSHISSLSDHRCVKLVLNLHLATAEQTWARNSYWKLNTAILLEDSFLECFEIFWAKILLKQTNFYDLADWWDNLAKIEIKEFCIGYSIQRKNSRDQRKQFLLSLLNQSMIRKDWPEIARLKEELDSMLKVDAMGFVIRSRFKQNVEEEKASIFHAAKELSNGKRAISRLLINGKTESDSNCINEEVIRYFHALFNGHHDCNLLDTGVPFVPDNNHLPEMLQYLSQMDQQSSDEMEAVVTLDELDVVIKKCANNKSPGLDGLPYEFYKSTWSLIKNTFLNVIKCQMERFRIVKSNTVGATRLCSKVNGVPTVEQLRPITLLNCDYKIMSKVLVLRMSQFYLP